MEVASLQPQNVASCFEQKDPLDKYSHGVTIPVHDAYPGSAYAHIKQKQVEEMEGQTFLVTVDESPREEERSEDENEEKEDNCCVCRL